MATSGEVLVEDEDNAFERDNTTDDTRVKTAVAWLEDAALLRREENHVQVFPSSLRVNSVDQARDRLAAKKNLTETRRRVLLNLVSALIAADADEGISTDELMGVAGLDSAGVRQALYDLEYLGLVTNDTGVNGVCSRRALRVLPSGDCRKPVIWRRALSVTCGKRHPICKRVNVPYCISALRHRN